MNERKLALLKKRAEKRKRLEAQQLELARAIEELAEKEIKVDVPEIAAPSVSVTTDTAKLEEIADKTLSGINALQSKLDDKLTIKALGELRSEISSLKSFYEGITKAIEQDIYARYDYTNSIEENGIRYIGYLNKDSDWFIQRLGTGTEGESSTFATGKRGEYKKSWANRLMLKYKLRDEVTIA